MINLTQVESGSTEYIANREVDQILKKGRDKIKHAITVSDEKLTKTKKQIVREMAIELDKAKYPTNQICERLVKSLKGLVADRTIRDALDSKYKNPEQAAVAGMQNGGQLRQIQEELEGKTMEQLTLDDLKNPVLDKTRVRRTAIYLKKRKDMLQYKVQDLEDENAKLKNMIQGMKDFYQLALDNKVSNEELGKLVRKAAKAYSKSKPKIN
jgi:hypothetical protein